MAQSSSAVGTLPKRTGHKKDSFLPAWRGVRGMRSLAPPSCH